MFNNLIYQGSIRLPIVYKVYDLLKWKIWELLLCKKYNIILLNNG
jgi:hypothetical protein